MLLEIPSPTNNVINDQSALNLVGIDNTLQVSCESLLCFLKFRRLTTVSSEVGLQDFEGSTSK